ncbi:hypothetical protein ABH19_06600 [Leptospirillum sp. Group II 'CF-1']|nr:hypothetical protein ABH19_06600 [Leptospirillum sp. Group II 'CF-1']
MVFTLIFLSMGTVFAEPAGRAFGYSSVLPVRALGKVEDRPLLKRGSVLRPLLSILENTLGNVLNHCRFARFSS